jgi:hypothetical protein
MWTKGEVWCIVLFEISWGRDIVCKKAGEIARTRLYGEGERKGREGEATNGKGKLLMGRGRNEWL